MAFKLEILQFNNLAFSTFKPENFKVFFINL